MTVVPVGQIHCESGLYIPKNIEHRGFNYPFSTSVFPYSARAGFNKGNGMEFFELPGSGTNEILFLSNTSYVNMSGVWIFRVDQDEMVSVGGT